MRGRIGERIYEKRERRWERGCGGEGETAACGRVALGVPCGIT
jgi:hypothetical protein